MRESKVETRSKRALLAERKSVRGLGKVVPLVSFVLRSREVLQPLVL